MSIFTRLYNWLAMRNIGEALGLRWDPEKDPHYQQRKLRQKAEDWAATLAKDRVALESGAFKQAGDHAYYALSDLPRPILPEIVRMHELANSIIARLPPDYRPPPAPARSFQPRLPADEAMARLKQAQVLVNQSKYEEAHNIIGDVLSHKIFSHGGADSLDATILAGTLNEAIWPHIKDKPL